MLLVWRTSVAVVTIVALAHVAVAQPLLDPTRPESAPATSNGGGAKIPVVGPRSTEVMAAEASGATIAPAQVALEEPIDPNQYICGPGDVFELEFWGQQNFRLRIAVDLEGRTFISKVGFVAVAGKTLSAVRTAITAKVRANYPGLKADLTLVSMRTFTVHVVGNVTQPGSYTARAVERASSVIAKAGVQPRGSRRRIAVKHRSGSSAIADLVMYELTGDTVHNPLLLDGDVITIPFAESVVTVAGAVRRPGSYELVKSKDISELLGLAGGFTSSVTRALPIQLVRRNEQEHQRITELPFVGPEAPNTPLSDEDSVYVRDVSELQRSVLLIGAVVGADPLDAATTSKRLPFIEGDTVLSLIERAGGVKAPGDLRRSYISRPRAGKDPELIAVDLEALLVRRDMKVDRKIQLADTIVIPPMRYSVLVEGAVSRAGLYNYNPTFGILQYLAQAGGRTRVAKDLSSVKLIDKNGVMHKFDVGLKPSPGDAILVPERNFSRAEVAQLVLAGASVLISGIAITLAATR
jgi:polysaccharide biosynthesis/export protein